MKMIKGYKNVFRDVGFAHAAGDLLP